MLKSISNKILIMKIGILTYHTPCNFGANLQAYCSSKYFESLGHTAKIINYTANEAATGKNLTEQEKAHRHFSQEVLHVTRPVSSGEEVYNVVKEEQFDVIAVGSDAIWSKRNRKRLEVFYCKWLWGTDLEDKVRVIALSPAFMGNDYHDLTDEERNNFKSGLLKFHSINTRDEWTRRVINRDIIGSDYIRETNPDPVFLLDKLYEAEWDKRDSNLDSKGYYIISLPNNYFRQLGWLKRKWLSALKREISQRGYKMVELPTPDGYSGYDGFDFVVKYPIDPLQWYLWIKNAKGFIGLRFHAVVSSISAGTPFFSLDSYALLNWWQRTLNLFGYHKKDREWGYKSKIKNIIEGSGLEAYRMNSTQVYTMNPRKIINMMERVTKEQILAFRDEKIRLFETNIKKALS